MLFSLPLEAFPFQNGGVDEGVDGRWGKETGAEEGGETVIGM